MEMRTLYYNLFIAYFSFKETRGYGNEFKNTRGNSTLKEQMV